MKTARIWSTRAVRTQRTTPLPNSSLVLLTVICINLFPQGSLQGCYGYSLALGMNPSHVTYNLQTLVTICQHMKHSIMCGVLRQIRPIICNGQEMAVTRNLRNALRRLRRYDSTRLVWIDAIYINQRNDEERGHQVRHVGSIYQRATRVLIWLRKDESEEAEQAFLLVCSIANRANDDF